MLVYFETTQDGRLMGRIDGKVVFPDRKFTEACEGPAEVEYTRIFETYSFVNGVMQRFDTDGTLSLKQLADFLVTTGNQYNGKFCLVNHPVRGEYWATGVHYYNNGYDAGDQTALIASKDDNSEEVKVTEKFCDFADTLMHTEAMYTYDEVLLYGTFGKDSAVLKSIEDFQESYYGSVGGYLIDMHWILQGSSKSARNDMLTLVESAIDTDFIHVFIGVDERWHVYGSECEQIKITHPENAIYFSDEEVIQLMDWASKQNAKCDEYIKNMCKRGKILTRKQ